MASTSTSSEEDAEAEEGGSSEDVIRIEHFIAPDIFQRVDLYIHWITATIESIAGRAFILLINQILSFDFTLSISVWSQPVVKPITACRQLLLWWFLSAPFPMFNLGFKLSSSLITLPDPTSNFLCIHGSLAALLV